MASTVFVNGSSLSDDDWFNDVNTITYTGLTTQILVGGGTGSVGVWTAATGTGAPVRATSPTIATPVINSAAHVGGTWVADATWTLPALTLGGTVSGGGNQINNVVIGTTTPLAGSFTTGTYTGTVSVAVSGMSNSVQLSQNASSAAYGSISFSGSHIDAGRYGFTAKGVTDVTLYYDIPTGGQHQFRVNAASVFTINSDTSISNPFIWANTGGTTAVLVDSAGTLYKSASARKYKEDFAPYAKGLSDMLKLAPQLYRLKSSKGQGYLQAGFLADDLHEQGFTEFVAYDKSEPESINYGNMMALTVNAFQDVNSRLRALEQRMQP